MVRLGLETIYTANVLRTATAIKEYTFRRREFPRFGSGESRVEEDEEDEEEDVEDVDEVDEEPWNTWLQVTASCTNSYRSTKLIG